MLAEINSQLTGLSSWIGNDLGLFALRLFLHLIVIFIIVRFLYYSKTKRRDYLFTYFLISTVIFLLSYMLESVKLEIGMALGLFAVFGIIRYRTMQIPIKEMTYLFIVIGVAVINALANNGVSMAELLASNIVIILITWSLEQLWRIPHVSSKVVQYDRIELIVPSRSQELKDDLRNRLGLDIFRFEVGKVDFLKDTAKLVVYYKTTDPNNTNMADDIENYTVIQQDN